MTKQNIDYDAMGSTELTHMVGAMMEGRLRLFVWTDFCPDYTGGLAIAIAHVEAEARQLVIKEMGCEPGDWGDLEIHELDSPIARYVSGGG